MSTSKHYPANADQLALFADEVYKPIEIHTVYQYLLVLSPPEEHTDKIKRLKYDLNHLAYLGSYNLFSVPHITLAKFQSVHRQLSSFGKPLQKVFAGKGALHIRLNGFNYLEEGHLRTLYLQIEEPQAIEAVMEQLRSSLNLPPRTTPPHLTIAKSMSAASFAELFPLLPPQGYTDAFVCDHLLVLERTIRQQKASHYKAVKKIKLT